MISLAGRRLMDGMDRVIFRCLIKAMLKKRIQIEGASVLCMGLSFKANCPELRNRRVVDIVAELKEYGIHTDVFDPWVDPQEAKQEYDINLVDPEPGQYDGMIIAVAHDQFKELGAQGIRRLGRESHVLYDLKYVLDRDDSDLRL